MSYAAFEHLEKFFESFATLYYDTSGGVGSVVIGTTALQADLNFSADMLDQRLDAITRIPTIPLGTSSRTGSYNPFVVEWNACDTIFRKLKSRHALEFRGQYPDWILAFGSRCDWILSSILSGNIVLDTDTTNKGIGIPAKIAQTGWATFYSNWNDGFYRGSDFPKTYRIKVTGTLNGNEIGQARYSISSDGGYSWWSSDALTGTTWCDIEDGLEVRWEPGTLTGTRKQIEYGDEWSILCTPASVSSIAAGVRFRSFKVG
jgi:hypothetical protein